MMSNYSRKDLIKFLQFQEDMPHLFLSREDELNGEFWGPDDEDYYDEPLVVASVIPKKYNDNLKSDNW